MANTPITVAHGDGIGPEIMAAGASLDVAKYESLYNFDGKAGYSLGQGQ